MDECLVHNVTFLFYVRGYENYIEKYHANIKFNYGDLIIID